MVMITISDRNDHNKFACHSLATSGSPAITMLMKFAESPCSDVCCELLDHSFTSNGASRRQVSTH